MLRVVAFYPGQSLMCLMSGNDDGGDEDMFQRQEKERSDENPPIGSSDEGFKELRPSLFGVLGGHQASFEQEERMPWIPPKLPSVSELQRELPDLYRSSRGTATGSLPSIAEVDELIVQEKNRSSIAGRKRRRKEEEAAVTMQSPPNPPPTIAAPHQGEEEVRTSEENICPVPSCRRVLSKRSSLKLHLRTHSDELPLSCPFPGCGRRFKWRSSFLYHKGTHRHDKDQS
uniref:C2H2-type domain-containing protein n=1 Tax=Compsopogon caeruleus TaxID=31354 RepID=A0A7S1TDJ4_9RHOD|mmetsp:Transcript_1863/g.3380  ORF Transcript_1863/g.3380 Transcript_1863/m.3380 type:complete len:229 (+) Transcript_1863:165-851(+)